MMETEKHEVIRLLKKDEIYNLSIIGFIQENNLEKFIRVDNSVLVQGCKEERWIYFSGDDKKNFNELIKKLGPGDKYFGAMDDWMIHLLTTDKQISWLINTYQFHFPPEKETPKNKIETKRLTVRDTEFLISQSNYKKILTVEYLNERIEKSISAGIYSNKKLVAWGLTHDDGSLGTLHVLEKYRRKGYAKEITISLIRQCREIGKIPFLQCETKNIPAQKLVEKMGFERDRRVSWLKLK